MKTILVILSTICLFRGASQEVPDFISSVQTFEEYKMLQGDPLSTKFGDVRSLKVVYSYQNDALYFINSSKFKYHLEFCEEVLNYYKGSFNFNYDNYTKTEGRDFILANINFYSSDSTFTLEFSIADQVKIKDVEFLHDKLSKHFGLTEEVKLFLNTSQLEERYKKAESTIPSIGVEEIYAGQTFQSIQAGTSYGILKFVDIAAENNQIWSDQVIVMKGTPNELSLVQGVIANELQTPLSHISILCKNRKTPFVAKKHAWNDSTLRSLEGKYVRLTVNSYNYKIEEIDEDTAKAHLAAKLAPKLNFELQRNLDQETIIDGNDLGYEDLNAVGAKAANFGELIKASQKKGAKFKTPENAFAIPFHFYLKHVENSGAQSLIDSLLILDYAEHEKQAALLKKIRKLIKNAAVDETLVEEITQKLERHSEFDSYRFRSSTNAEDVEGFNGAGLYSSTSVILGHEKKTVERGLRKVWAGVWNNRAFFERLYFGIDQTNVAIGVLVHRGFPDELANGVSITHNIYRPANLGFVINIQSGDVPVVNPPFGVVCDQLICYSDTDNTFYNPKRIVEYISTSSKVEEGHVLDDKQVVTLTKELAKVKKHFYRKVNKNWLKYDYQSFALDIEFKLDKSGDFYVKQARPF
jgi:hypothetical protein